MVQPDPRARLAVQLSKYLGAGKVIATGRNEDELQELLSLGADAVIPFILGSQHPLGAKHYEQALKEIFASGINVVVDYLWGESARTIIVAIAKAVEDAMPVRFIHVGGASREEEIGLPGAALRSSAIQLMGSGVKSIPFPKLLDAIRNVFQSAGPAKLQIATPHHAALGDRRSLASAWQATRRDHNEIDLFHLRIGTTSLLG